MRHICLVVAVLLALGGCGGSSTSSNEAKASLGCEDGNLRVGMSHVEVEGTTRSYEIYVPPSYDGTTPMPLVLNFHGITADGSVQAASTEMNDAADERGLILVYPNGFENSWNGGVCCGGAYADGVDDIAYTRAVIAQVGETGCVDTRRVYATGFSNGAIMTHSLACEASDVIAAAAPVSGPRLVEPEQCSAARPMPLLLIQGTDDSLSPYALGEQAFADWREHYECTGERLVEMYASGTCETYDDCAEGGSATFCSIPDHDHCWPGPLACSWDETPTDFPGNEVILDFFGNAALPAD